MADVIFVDDELEEMPEPPGRRSRIPESLRGEADPLSAKALLEIIRHETNGLIKVVPFWNPREALNQIEKASSPPVVLVLDILNERRSKDMMLSEDGRCGLVLAERSSLKFPRTPIVFLTQFDCYDEERGRAAAIGTYADFITKRSPNTIKSLQDRLRTIFKRHLEDEGIIECGRLRLDPLRIKVFWRTVELGSTVKVRDAESPDHSREIDLTDIRLTLGEFLLLRCMMKRARPYWVKGNHARVTFEEIREDCGPLGDETIHKYVKEIRKTLGDVQHEVFHEARESAYGVFVNDKKAYVFTEH